MYKEIKFIHSSKKRRYDNLMGYLENNHIKGKKLYTRNGKTIPTT